jgi:hypothetical protein
LQGEIAAEADKVKGLKSQLDGLAVSFAAEKEAALKSQEVEHETNKDQALEALKATHVAETADLISSHKKEIGDLKAAHAVEVEKLSNVSIHQELRRMREQGQGEQQREIASARAHERAMTEARLQAEFDRVNAAHAAELGDLRAEQADAIAKMKESWDKEKAKVVEEALGRLREEHAAETAAMLTRQRADMEKKANGEMKALSDAHSAKTASLENQIAEALALEQTAKEKARKTVELESSLDSQSKELATTKADLEAAKKKLADLEAEHAK